MIPRADITAWREYAPWKTNEQVEQDLAISRFLVELFSNDILRDKLAFRGGTAIHKLFMKSQARYSDDIDLVQIDTGPIGEVIDIIKEVSFIKNKPRIKQKEMNTTIVFPFNSEIQPVINMKLKIEINCREHSAVYGLNRMPFEVKTKWFYGKTQINTYTLEELLGTKIRALYQRKKGRDLFDLWYVLVKEKPSQAKIMNAFQEYMKSSGKTITQREFIKNIELKLKDNEFSNDLIGLIRPEIEYDMEKAWQIILQRLICELQ